MTDISKDILRRCTQGDASAFAQLVEIYERPLFAYVYRFTAGERAMLEPEDIVQEIFLKTWKAFPRWNPDEISNFDAWIFRIARNHLISLLRRKNPEMVRDDDEGDGLLGRIVDVGSESPRDIAAANQLKDRVSIAISTLPEKLRSAFLLRYYENLSYEEIAERLECSIGTVRSRISRARDFLAQYLKDYCDVEGRLGEQ